MEPYSLLGIIIVVLDIIAIFSILLGRSSVGHKVLWTILVLVFPIVGMIVYYVIGRSPQDA
jgi:hypothetical protein